LKIVVTVKLVPDTNAEKRIDSTTKRLVRTGIETVLNPFDEYALEAALQLKDKLGAGTTVTVLTLGPETGKEVVRKALAMGADDATIVSDAGFAGSDVWVTGQALAAALKKIGFDLVICGGLAEDGNTGGVVGALAEHLGVPGLTNAAKIDVADNKLTVQRETDSGHQTVSAPLPAVMMVTMGVGEPRYASLKGIMGAKKKTIAIVPSGELTIDGPIGNDGAKTELVTLAAPAVRGKGKVVAAEDGPSGAKIIFDFLKERKLV
jgi:electron transfer flavoprotein beta subunit